MNTKTISLALVIIILSVGAYHFLASSAPNATPEQAKEHTGANDTSALRAEENMVVVSEQKPGDSIVGTVHLAAPGYLVIHEDNDGKPGAIIGSSALLPAGDSTDVTVTLSRGTKNGDMLHAMLHFEKGGNTSFSAAEDTPVPSSLGGPISGWFHIADDAPEMTPISI